MHAQPIHLPRAITSVHQVSRSPFHKGSKSKTHKGDKDFTTKKGSAVFDEDHHFIRRDRRPFSNERLKPSKFSSMHAKNTRGFTTPYKGSKGARQTKKAGDNLPEPEYKKKERMMKKNGRKS